MTTSTGLAAAAAQPAVVEREDDAVVALRDRLLETSWQYLGVLERLGQSAAQRLHEEVREAETADAFERLQPLPRWKGLPETSHATYVSPNNHVRLARLLDFVEPGERVLDIGIGFGYPTSVLLRSGLLEAYVGFDLDNRYLTATRQGLEANGLSDEGVQLEVKDVYELTPEWVAQHRPTLVLMLEVLEHVPDPKRALEQLGASLARGTSLLFTVPMLNRLEGVMGHRSLFDRTRLEELCGYAGLTIQYVEPLRGIWTLVLASTSQEVPSRVIQMARVRPPRQPPQVDHEYTFVDVNLRGPSLDFRRQGRPKRGRARVKSTRRGLRCEVTTPPNWTAPIYGGVAFPAKAPAILRLQVHYEQPERIRAVMVDGYDGDERVAAWKWVVGNQRVSADKPMVHLLKPGGGGRFVPRQQPEIQRIERVEVYVELAPGADEAAFRLVRAAYAPAPDPSDAQAAPDPS
jgi:2-polyprenyl-3-methyl-5-hydroxy-6-metoxy-1,4-benzoquinol methylase